MLSFPRIALRNTRAAEWIDETEKERIGGYEFFYIVLDEYSGEWLIKVRSPSNKGSTIISVVEGTRCDWISDCIKKRVVHFFSSKDPVILYSPLNIACVKDEKKLSFVSPRSIEEVPDFLLQRFEITWDRKVAPLSFLKLSAQLVALVPRGLSEKMVELFILENMWPVISVPASTRKKGESDLALLQEFLHDRGVAAIETNGNELKVHDFVDVVRISSKGEIVAYTNPLKKKRIEEILSGYSLWRGQRRGQDAE